MIIYCPTKQIAYYGEGMSYDKLMDRIKKAWGFQRAPRGSLQVHTGAETWEYKGRMRSIPPGALRTARELDEDGRIIDRIDVTGKLASPQVIDDMKVEPYAPPPKKEDPEVTGSLDQVIRDIAGEEARKVAEGTVNEDRVREICVEEVESAKLPRPVEITIHKPDGPKVEVKGVHAAFEQVMRWIQTGPVMLIGPTGGGKTRLAEDVAKALGVTFYVTGQTISKGDIVGYDTVKGYRVTPFLKAFQGPDTLHLADEIDGWSANATLSFNAALSNGYGSFPISPEPVERGKNTYDMAAANTAGHGADRVYVGRNQLDGATLDRYVQIMVDYDVELEARIAEGFDRWLAKAWSVRDKCKVAYPKHVISTRSIARGVKALTQGAELDEVVTRLLRRNLNDADWQKVGS